MITKRIPHIQLLILIGLTLSLGKASAQTPAQANAPEATTYAFTYQGQLKKNGEPHNGACDFKFSLFDAVTGGNKIGSTQNINGVNVADGLFNVQLNKNGQFGVNPFTGLDLWLKIQVKCGGDGSYTNLTPRQPLTAAPYALGLKPGSRITGAVGTGLTATSTEDFGVGLFGQSTGTTSGIGVHGKVTSPAGYGVYGENTASNTVGMLAGWTLGRQVGVYGEANDPSGDDIGVYGLSRSPNGYGGYFINNNANGISLYATGSGATKFYPTLRVDNIEGTHGMAAYITNYSDYATTHFYNAGSGQVLWLQNGGTTTGGSGGGDFITAINKPQNDIQFRVTTSGQVRSDVGFYTPAADFAEMLPAGEGLEPGDVLVIGPDGRLARSTQAYQPTVVGVHSTQPGFVGGQPVEGELSDHAPLALVGVAPVKASAENGPIHPGNMLVAASTPGHAMRAGTNPPTGTVIGKALEPLRAGTGLIRMLVTLQ
jgi:hypothetical protein